MITNPLKDIQDGSINSKHPETFAKNLIEAGKQIKNKGQYYQLYIANGGSYETYFNYNTGFTTQPDGIPFTLCVIDSVVHAYVLGTFIIPLDATPFNQYDKTI